MNEIWTVERRALALAEALHWRGVPHHDRMSLYPVGIDCAQYVRRILLAAGLIDDRELGPYHTQVGLYRSSTRLRDVFTSSLHCVAMPVDLVLPEFGDVVVMKTGRTSAHCGWYADDQLYHCLAQRSVVVSPWAHWWHHGDVLIRITEPGYKAEPIERGVD